MEPVPDQFQPDILSSLSAVPASRRTKCHAMSRRSSRCARGSRQSPEADLTKTATKKYVVKMMRKPKSGIGLKKRRQGADPALRAARGIAEGKPSNEALIFVGPLCSPRPPWRRTAVRVPLSIAGILQVTYGKLVPCELCHSSGRRD